MKNALTFLPYDNIFAYASEKVIEKEEPNTHHERFVVGKCYKIDDEEGLYNSTIYKLIKVIDSVNELPFNTLILTPLTEASSSYYALTKDDCKRLGIEYQDNLYPFSQTMNWVEVSKTETYEHKEFDPSDLSTYPLDKESKSIKRMVLRLTGFKLLSSRIIKFKNDNFYLPDFVGGLDVRIKEKHFDREYGFYPSRRTLPYRFVTDKLVDNSNPYVDNKTNSVFIEIDLSFVDPSTDKVKVLPLSFFENKSIEDIFVISWTGRMFEDGERPMTKNRVADMPRIHTLYSKRYFLN